MAKKRDIERESEKASYQTPELELVIFSNAGVLTSSSPTVKEDENEGEWDPLTVFLLG